MFVMVGRTPYSFIDATQASYLVQHVMDCTQHRQGQRSSLLDLVFTTDRNAIEEVTSLFHLGSSDHVCLLWNFKCYDRVLSTGQNVPKYNYRKGDYVSMNDNFSGVNWLEVLSSLHIQNHWDMFMQIIHGAVSSFIPTFVTKLQKLSLSWWSESLSRVVKAKQVLHSKCRHSRLNSEYVIKETK